MLFITQRLLWPLTELGDTFDLYQRAMASFKRINALKNTQPDIQNGSIEAGSIEKFISLEDVNFSYVDNFPVLNDVSINIKKGSTTAIVGSTGSGKSTLIFGEDSGKIGDVNQGLEGLQEKYGVERVGDRLGQKLDK